MTEREKLIAAAAIRVFARYGVKRATMNDVAQEAGVVRQTLYTVFSNKDEVLRGTIRLFADSQWEKIRAGWSEVDSLGEKLDIMFKYFILEAWELIHDSPDAAELERGFNAAGRAEITVAAQRTLQEMENLISAHEAALARRGESPKSIADFVYMSISGIKYGAESLQQAKLLAATLRTSTLALCGIE